MCSVFCRSRSRIPTVKLSAGLSVYILSGLYTYPDAMVICGAIQLVEAPLDTVANPSLIVEVLSDSTAEYDRGDKFLLYQPIATLRDYILIEQNKVAVDHYARSAEDVWILHSHSELSETVMTAAAPATLLLADVYASVFS